LVSSFAPVITLIILPWMIPNALQTERLMDENSTAVDGSLWRRFMSRNEESKWLSPDQAPSGQASTGYGTAQA